MGAPAVVLDLQGIDLLALDAVPTHVLGEVAELESIAPLFPQQADVVRTDSGVLLDGPSVTWFLGS